jgi:NitT/TauT family transport system substrate-binding protein
MYAKAYRSSALLRLLAILGLVAAACGGTPGAGTASPTTSTSAAPAAAGDIVLPKPERTDVRIGASALSGAGSGPAIIARQLDLYKKYGLSATHNQFNSATQAMQALLAEQIDISDNSEGPVLATVGTSSPTQFVFVPRANNSDILYTQSSIKTASDLRGKTIAISSFGSNSHAGVIYALKALKLTEKDVTITTVGSDTQRLAALRSGAVNASIQDNTVEKDLNAAGYNSLVRMQDIKPPFGQPGAGTVISVAYLKKNPNVVLAVVAAKLEANWMMQTRTPDELAPILAKELKDVPTEELKRQIALVQQEPWTPKDGMCRLEDVQFGKEIAVITNPSLANVDPLLICNNDFLNQLKALGFQKKLGIPGY